MNDNQPVVVEISDTLDLHHFKAKEIPDLLNEYIAVCREKKIYTIRLIHGKGKGILRDRVHSILKKHPDVNSFSLATEGNWGATIVCLSTR